MKPTQFYAIVLILLALIIPNGSILAQESPPPNKCYDTRMHRDNCAELLGLREVQSERAIASGKQPVDFQKNGFGKNIPRYTLTSYVMELNIRRVLESAYEKSQTRTPIHAIHKKPTAVSAARQRIVEQKAEILKNKTSLVRNKLKRDATRNIQTDRLQNMKLNELIANFILIENLQNSERSLKNSNAETPVSLENTKNDLQAEICRRNPDARRGRGNKLGEKICQ